MGNTWSCWPGSEKAVLEELGDCSAAAVAFVDPEVCADSAVPLVVVVGVPLDWALAGADEAEVAALDEVADAAEVLGAELLEAADEAADEAVGEAESEDART